MYTLPLKLLTALTYYSPSYAYHHVALHMYYLCICSTQRQATIVTLLLLLLLPWPSSPSLSQTTSSTYCSTKYLRILFSSCLCDLVLMIYLQRPGQAIQQTRHSSNNHQHNESSRGSMQRKSNEVILLTGKRSIQYIRTNENPVYFL